MPWMPTPSREWFIIVNMALRPWFSPPTIQPAASSKFITQVQLPWIPIAGVDRPLKGVRREHVHHIGDLHDVQPRGDPRHHVLAGRRRRREEGVVAGGLRGD